MQQQSKKFNLLIMGGLFLLALIPRLPDLGRFLTADEFLWVDRSRNFLAGLTNSAYQCTTVVEQWEFAQGLACTLRTGHPGVTTMWTGSFGFLLRWLWDGQPNSFHDYVVAISTNPLDASFIAPERIGTVIITSLWVVAIYWLVRRLWGPRIALIGAVLIALDPFHIALSRVIHHDALSTTFMTLSVLTAFIYWGQHEKRRWLILSGVLAGFGFLSKSPSLYLMPFIALTGFWFTAAKVYQSQAEPSFRSWPYYRDLFHALPRTVLEGISWFLVAIGIVFLFWPAMWVVPLETVSTVFFIGSKYATGGHAKGNYFLGQISKDPGPLFYPVTWLYRISPLALVGILGIIFRRQIKRHTLEKPSPSPPTKEGTLFHYLPLILLYIGGYYLLMTIGEKKQDRYFLPVYPWTNLLAASGLITLINYLAFRYKKQLPFFRSQGIAMLLSFIIGMNGFLVVLHYPYYFTYYNPLLGGITTAEQMVTIGWGEGLDLAATYLNQHVPPEETRVASWYESTFAPFYEGPSISYSKEKGKALAGDYVVFYINQAQRQFPDEILFEYFQNRFDPAQTIQLQGVDYVWIYPSLGVDHYIQDQTYTGMTSLLAWQWSQGDTRLTPDQTADFELYWEYLGKHVDEPFFMRLLDAQGRVWAEGQSHLVSQENPAPEDWRGGEILFERGSLVLPPDIPPGIYEIQIGFYTDAPAVKKGELLFDMIPPEEGRVTIGHTPPTLTYQLPQRATPIHQSVGERLTLLGATIPPQLPLAEDTSPLNTAFHQDNDDLSHPHWSEPPPDLFEIDLYWQVEKPIPSNFDMHVALVDSSTDEVQQAWFSLSLGETFNPSETIWQPEDIIHTRWHLDLLPETPPGEYHLEVVLASDTDQIVPLGPLTIEQTP